jgi:ankyrin repeat protein
VCIAHAAALLRWGNTPLTCAARNGHADAVALLLQHNAAVNAQADYG